MHVGRIVNRFAVVWFVIDTQLNRNTYMVRAMQGAGNRDEEQA